MSDTLNPALAELKDLLVATWPQIVKANGGKRLWEGEHHATFPFEQTINDHGLPYAVIIPAGEARPADLDQEESYDFLDLEIYYVGEAPGSATSVRTALQTLREVLWPAGTDGDPLTLAQVWERPVLAWGLRQVPLNQTFRAKKLPLLAGRLTLRLLTGEPE